MDYDEVMFGGGGCAIVVNVFRTLLYMYLQVRRYRTFLGTLGTVGT